MEVHTTILPCPSYLNKTIHVAENTQIRYNIDMKIRNNSEPENGYSRLHVKKCFSCGEDFGTYKKQTKTCDIKCQHKLIQVAKGNIPPTLSCEGDLCFFNIKGTVFKIDKAQKNKLLNRHFHISKWGNGNKYALSSNKGEIVALHTLILGKKEGYVIDHINGDTTDNRKSNLRHCTHVENIRNSKSSGGSSIYKGVSKVSRHKPWRARLMLDRKEIHLGLFKTEKEAAKAYNEGAIKHFGKFALLNDLSNPGQFLRPPQESANDHR